MIGGLRWYHIPLALVLMPFAAVRAAFTKSCYWSGHLWVDDGKPFEVGDTSAPYPAVDELRQRQICPRCRASQTRWVGFIFDNENKKDTP